jgi:hypothetical protein
MFAITPFQIQVLGIVILVAIGLAAGWWVVRAAMGWQSGRAIYWLNQPPSDDDSDDDDDADGGDVR